MTTNQLIRANSVSKRYGSRAALDGASFTVAPGRIVGIIGRNGAGKTTVVRAILGLIDCSGELTVLGRNPFRERAELMLEASFIADVAVMPAWLKVAQAIDFVSGVHPRFRRERAEQLIAHARIPLTRRIGDLSKGLKTQVHLALTLAIDARLLVLDEPTLGLDPLARRSFYETIVNDYLDEQRTIVVTSNEVAELEHFLTDVIILDEGRVILSASVSSLSERYAAVEIPLSGRQAAQALKPFHERATVGGALMYFDRTAMDRPEELGQVHIPGVAELCIALLSRSS
jgi:ABC-2 type transport system ATP-binding protein